MKKKACLAFVLGGGGARGALQVGALRAMQEAGIQPDLLVGTSAGAINATFIALRGFSARTLDELEAAWYDAAEADLLPANYLWLTVRVLFNRVRIHTGHRMRTFFVSHGLDPELRFKDAGDLPFILVASDLVTRKVVLFGSDPEHLVLEGLLASTALPPWVHPLEKDGQMLMDGGVVSNLPVEPALRQGASEIIALDLSDPRPFDAPAHGFSSFLYRMMDTVERRQVDLEMDLARARGVPVHRIMLQAEHPLATWDFSHTAELIARGYQIARRQMASGKLLTPAPRRSWWSWLGFKRRAQGD